MSLNNDSLFNPSFIDDKQKIFIQNDFLMLLSENTFSISWLIMNFYYLTLKAKNTKSIKKFSLW